MEYENLENKIGDYATFFLAGTASQTAANYPVFFTARHPVELAWITETHSAAGTDGGAVTLDIRKLASGIAPTAGSSMLVSTFNLKSTANTPVTKEGYVGLVSNNARVLIEGQRIGAVSSGTLTALEGVTVTAYFKYVNLGSFK